MTNTFRMIEMGDRAQMRDMAGEVYAYFRGIAGNGDIAATERERDDFADLSLGDDPLCNCLLALNGDRIVGYMAYYYGTFDTDRAFYIAGLFVREKARGQGLGRQFMDLAYGLAEKRRAQRIVWQVWVENDPALRFYEGLGAEYIPEEKLMTIRL
ncbi:GNAT family N-acetyltransferase [Aestuariispira insulae]|uniref:Acetyltransferase (GNAT) family protein n=1 Tax=Aestuariispira insulae TaxID=1461337 RepID=A0A3D9HT92_9PROT|nr:GNAT family N-acetyltransferase [Aestuariispira insulae]RED52096.1 acetyltransferase (GNAT) family protein [Aestuariispira insulae]